MKLLRVIFVGPYLLYMVLAMSLGRFFWPFMFGVAGLFGLAFGIGYWVGK
jgi:hypothetical protein